MKVAVVTITCRECGRVLRQSIPRIAEPDEIPTERPCNYPFAQADPCPDHPHGVADGLPLLWTVRQIKTPSRGDRP